MKTAVTALIRLGKGVGQTNALQFSKDLMVHARVVSGLTVVGVAAMLSLIGGRTDQPLFAVVCLGLSILAGIAAYALLLGREAKRKSQSVTIEDRYWELRQVAGIRDELLLAWYIPVATNVSAPALAFAVTVLRVRMGKLLGVEQGQENARRHRDRWTYAVFLVAATSYPADRVTIAESLERLFMFVPETARSWLGENSNVGKTMMDAMARRSRDNPIWQIVDTPAKAQALTLETVMDALHNDVAPEPVKPEAKEVSPSDETKAVEKKPVKSTLTVDTYHDDNVQASKPIRQTTETVKDEVASSPVSSTKKPRKRNSKQTVSSSSS